MVPFYSVLGVDTTKTTCIADAVPREITRNGVTRTILLSPKGWERHVFGVQLLCHSMPWLTRSEEAFLIGSPVWAEV